MRWHWVVAGAIVCATGWGQTGDAVRIWTRTDLALASGKSTSTMKGGTLGTFGDQSCSVWTRTASGEAELHRRRTDLLVIEDGAATLRYGGTISHARDTGSGEVRGASIQGGQSRKVSPGDVIRIPAGTPHQFLLEAGQHVMYFALKS